MKEVPYQQALFRIISFKISWSNLVLEKNGFWLENSALCCNILSFVKETLDKKFYTLRSIYKSSTWLYLKNSFTTQKMTDSLFLTSPRKKIYIFKALLSDLDLSDLSDSAMLHNAFLRCMYFTVNFTKLFGVAFRITSSPCLMLIPNWFLLLCLGEK